MVPGILSQNLGLPNREKNGTGFASDASSLAMNAPLHGAPCSRLEATADEEVHDLVCVGFGPASLAIAVALHDLLDPARNVGLVGCEPKVRFLERQEKFGWHAGMLLPGAKMQISFIKDLATLRDPCSYFTFLNYLKQHHRLVQFSNLGTFLPSRLEFEDYMRWAATHFADVVGYGQQVDHIRPCQAESGGKVRYLEIHTRDLVTGQINKVLSKNVVIAVGGKPAKPALFLDQHDQILHSSEYSTRIEKALPAKDKPYKLVVVGSGQSAAEIFNDLYSRYPNASTKLIFRDTALRPSDDSPFVNEVFNPEAVNAFFGQTKATRGQILTKNKATNYSVVRSELLERIYEEQYMQSIKHDNRNLWQHQILSSREIVHVVEDSGSKQISLTLRNLEASNGKVEEIVRADAVILATGYKRDAHLEMLQGCEALRKPLQCHWQIERNYGLTLDRSLVEEDVGIWLQGCNEETHGLSDSLLSILATRSGELVQSIFGRKEVPNGN